MQAHELFPGAVVIHDDIVKEVKMPSFDWVHLIGEELPEHRDFLSPLPLSPAVLAGLGFEYVSGLGYWAWGDEFIVSVGNNPVYHLGEIKRDIIVESAHQLQSLALHLYGITLTWNQAAYEKAKGEGK